MSYSLDFTTHADVINTELRMRPSATDSEAGLTTSTAWDNTYSYGKNQVVKYADKYWISKSASINLNNTPIAGSSFWDAFVPSGSATNTGMVWRGEWNSGITYSIGDVVSQTFSLLGRGVVFISIVNSNISNPPNGSPLSWEPLSPSVASVQPSTLNGGLWQSGTRYFPNTIVGYNAPGETTTGYSFFVCIADTDGNTTVLPITAATSRNFWLPLDSSTYTGTWNTAYVYNKDNVVVQNGTLFQSVADNNTANNPNTVPPTNWLAYGLKAMRIPFSATALLSGALNTTTPTNLKTINATNLGNVQYNYARGFGYLLISAGTWAGPVTFQVYLSTTSAGAVPTDNTLNISYISTASIVAPATNTYFDLSRITYYFPSGILPPLYLVINNGGVGATGVTIIPVGSTTGAAQGTTAQAQPSTTIGTVATAGVAGFEFFRAPYGPV